jgi:sugar/nucleoside kinase (ribokinase family)
LQPKPGVSASASVQLVAVGDANVELVLPQLPAAPRFGQELVVPEMTLRAAGSAANFALCAATLGARTGFAGCLGIDRFGEVVLQAFREAGVDTQWLRLLENQATGISVALIRKDGERAFVTYQGSNARLTLQDIKGSYESATPPRWLHLGGYNLLDELRGAPAMKLLEEARKRGITTSLDTGWDPKGWSAATTKALRDTLQFIDVFLPNTLELRALTGETSPRRGAEHLLQSGASTVVAKLGPKGCLVVTRRDQRRIPAFDVHVVDTTAAGDAFNAGFVVSMLSGATVARAAVFGSAVAALRISRQLNEPLFPTLQETTAFLMRWRPLEA